MTKKITTTTFQIDSELYDQFRTINIRTKFNLKELVTKCIHLYVTDEGFRKLICDYQIPILSPEAQAVPITIITGSMNGTTTA